MAILDANPGPDNSASPNDNASADSSVGSYLIKKGDTLTKIAKNNNSSVDELLKANPQITNRDLIYAGSKLTVPGAATPTVIGNQTDLSKVKTDEEIDAEINANAAAAEKDILANSEQVLTDDQIEDAINASVEEAKAQEGPPDNSDIEDYENGGYGGASQAENDALNNALGGGLGSKPLSVTGSSSGSPDTTIGAKAVTPFLRDYQHASKLFWSGQLPDGQKGLMPKNGFLFHVVFDLSPNVTRDFSLAELGMLVKSASLPKFTVELKQQNAYNRVNFTQTKIKYDPVNITFHDDSSNVVRDFWFSYFNYYYRDSDYSESLYQIKHKYNERSAINWGYTPKKPKNSEFLNTIRIFSLHQKNFSEYVLINPIIKSFKHGDHRYEDGNGLMSHDMTIEYETVLYYSGNISEDTVKGFGTVHYDRTPSPNLGKEQNLIGPGSATDKTNKGSNRLPAETSDGSKQSPENPTKKPPAKDWLTGVGNSVFGEGKVGNFVTNKIFVPMAKSVAYNATSKVTVAINKTIGQSIAKVQGALGPVVGGIVVPAVTESFGGIPNVGTYLINNGSKILSNATKKSTPVSQEITQSNNTPGQMSVASALSILQPTTQNNAINVDITNQGQPGINSTNDQMAQTLGVDAQIKRLSQSLIEARAQLSKYQSQVTAASTNVKFFGEQIDENLTNGISDESPIIKKLQLHLSQQMEIMEFAETQVVESNQLLMDLQKSKQTLVKGLVRK
jgi:LysM repeat protein